MSLIIHNDHTDSYAVHPIVHIWARERPRMRLAEQALWADVIGLVLAASVLVPPEDMSADDGKYHTSLLAHVEHVQACRQSTAEAIARRRRSANSPLSWISSLMPSLAPDTDKVRMYSKFSLVYAKCGRWDSAKDFLQYVLQFLTRHLALQHKRSRRAAVILSTVYFHLGRSSDAAVLQTSVLDICNSHLGSSHPETPKAMSELGSTR